MATEYGSDPVGRRHRVRSHRSDRNELIVSYVLLRKIVGWIGTLLSAALLAGNAAVFSGPRLALCPTCPPVAHLSAARQAAAGFHVFFAVIAFIALGLMALRFAKSRPTPGGYVWPEHHRRCSEPRQAAEWVISPRGLPAASWANSPLPEVVTDLAPCQ